MKKYYKLPNAAAVRLAKIRGDIDTKRYTRHQPTTRTPGKWLTITAPDGRTTEERTVNRWASGTNPPRHAQLLMSIIFLGWIPHEAWRHFRLLPGRLEDHLTGEHFTPDNINSITWVVNHNSQLRGEIHTLQQRVKNLTDSLALISRRHGRHTRHWHRTRAPAQTALFPAPNHRHAPTKKPA